MMWISFAWTTKAFLAGNKTVTRRFWNKEYMEKWWKVTCENNGIAIACNRSPRWGGKEIGKIRVTIKPYLQKLKFVTDADEIKEGHLWGNAMNFIEMMGGEENEPYVVEFEPILEKKPQTCLPSGRLRRFLCSLRLCGERKELYGYSEDIGDGQERRD